MRLSQKIALHTGIQISGKVISLAIGLFSVILMTRFLGTSGYGDYNTVIALLSFFSIAADLGLYLLFTREISRFPERQSEIAGNIFTLRLVSAIVVVSLAPLVALFLPYSAIVKTAIMLGVLAFVFSSLTQVLAGVFQREFKTHFTVIGEIASRAVFLGAAIWLFFYLKEESLILLIAALIVSNLVNFVIVFLSSRKFLKIRLRFDKDYWKYAIKESFPIAASIVLGLIYFKIDIIMLSIMKTSSDVGIYGVAYKILEILIVFPAMFLGVMFPLFSRTFREEIGKFRFLFQRSLNLMIISSVPVAIGGYLLAKPLIILISGQPFEASAEVLKILIIATGVIFIGNLFGHLIVVVGAQKRMVKVYLIGALTNIVLNILLIPKFSYMGAAIATLVTELTVVGLAVLILKRSIDFLPSFALFVKVGAAGAIMGIVLLLINNISIILLIPIGAIVYFSVLYFFKGLPSGILGLLKQ